MRGLQWFVALMLLLALIGQLLRDGPPLIVAVTGICAGFVSGLAFADLVRFRP